MSQPTDMFGIALADIATRVTRQAVEADPVLGARLANLQGNSVELQCTSPPVTWHIQIEAGGLRTLAGPALAPQAIVRGNLLALSSWLLPSSDTNGNSASLEISGDNTLLMELADIVKDFRPDFAAPISNFLGDELANTLVGTAEAGLQVLQSLVRGAGRTAQEQASSQFVQRPQLQEFLQGVDELRLRVDRLAARVSEVEKATTPGGVEPPVSSQVADHGH